MAEWIGARMVIGIGLILSGLLTALTPLAADWSFWAVYSTRILTGLLGVSVNRRLNLLHLSKVTLISCFIFRECFFQVYTIWSQNGRRQMKKVDLYRHC